MRSGICCLIWTLALNGACFAAPDTEPSSSANSTTFDCVIEPEQIVKLASPVVGVIGRLDVNRGDVVRRGQLLGKLEDGVEAAMLALAQARAKNESLIRSAQARLQFLRLKHARIIELHSKAIGSLASLQEAEAEATVAAEQVNEAKSNLQIAALDVRRAEEVVTQRTLRSPVDGVVVERLLLPGEYRNEQTPILTIAEINPLKVEVFIPTSYYGQIRVGDIAEIQPERPIGGAYSATTTVVDRVLDAASGTFGVRLALPNPELRLPAGIRCKAMFHFQRSESQPAFTAQGTRLN